MTDNELRNKFYNEFGEKAYDGFLPNITYKTKYVEWLEQQVKNCSIPDVVGQSEQCCDEWIHEARVKQNDDTYCPICGKKLQ